MLHYLERVDMKVVI